MKIFPFGFWPKFVCDFLNIYKCQEISAGGTKAPLKTFQGRPKCLILATFQKSHLRGDLKIQCHGEKNFNGFLAHNFFKDFLCTCRCQGKNSGRTSLLILHFFNIVQKGGGHSTSELGSRRTFLFFIMLRYFANIKLF